MVYSCDNRFKQKGKKIADFFTRSFIKGSQIRKDMKKKKRKKKKRNIASTIEVSRSIGKKIKNQKSKNQIEADSSHFTKENRKKSSRPIHKRLWFFLNYSLEEIVGFIHTASSYSSPSSPPPCATSSIPATTPFPLIDFDLFALGPAF